MTDSCSREIKTMLDQQSRSRLVFRRWSSIRPVLILTNGFSLSLADNGVSCVCRKWQTPLTSWSAAGWCLVHCMNGRQKMFSTWDGLSRQAWFECKINQLFHAQKPKTVGTYPILEWLKDPSRKRHRTMQQHMRWAWDGLHLQLSNLLHPRVAGMLCVWPKYG